jgi:hypothetical protein
MSENKDGIYAEMTGTVTDIGFKKADGSMFARMQLMKTRKDGTEYPQKFTAWDLQNTSVSKGSQITVAGKLAIKLDSWTGDDGITRPRIDIALNESKIITRDSPSGQEAPVEEFPYSDVPADEWAVAPVGENEVPF